nr:hypothetical protein [Tanacetum cinerariifolium]
MRGGEEDFLKRMLQIRGDGSREDVLDRDKSADKGSDSTDEMSHILGTLGAANILASGGLRSVFTTASLSVPTASIGVSHAVATASGSFSTVAIFTTASSGGLRLVFTTASLSVPTASTGVSHAVATASGSFSTVTIFTTACVATPTTRVTRSLRGVVIGSSSLISSNIPSISKKDKGKGKMTEPGQPSKEKRDNEIARIHAEKELKMMIAELDRSNEMVVKYLMWEKMQDFVPMNSKLESERLKRPGIQLDKERIKKLKTAEASAKELWVELKRLYELDFRDPLWALQRNHTEVYQIFEDMLKKVDREDLNKLWCLVKEACSTTKVTDEKAKELWVELKRLYELDSRDPLWALQSISVPTVDIYTAKKFATVEDFALLHEDNIYSESKTRACYI